MRSYLAVAEVFDVSCCYVMRSCAEFHPVVWRAILLRHAELHGETTAGLTCHVAMSCYATQQVPSCSTCPVATTGGVKREIARLFDMPLRYVMRNYAKFNPAV